MSGVQGGKENSKAEDEPKNVDTIPVHIGVFFDGTGNSMMNVKERIAYDKLGKEIEHRAKYYKSNDSHENELSNVATQFLNYNIDEKSNKYRVYIEGIGTAPRPVDTKEEFVETIEYFEKKGTYDDSTLASALGYGDYGVNGKIERGVEQIISILNEVVNDHDESVKIKLTLDVFGFSRGAAAARSFTSRIKEPKGDTRKYTKADVQYAMSQVSPISRPNISLSIYNSTLYKKMIDEGRYRVCLMDELTANNIEISEPIIVNFLGLYDTVSSYGLSFADDVEELALTIDESIVEKCYQICAGDEYRKNFSLTLIKPFDNNYLIPGAHSDIGGGYGIKDPEKFILYQKKFLTIRALNYWLLNPVLATALNTALNEPIYAGNKSREELINGGWYTEAQAAVGERKLPCTYQIIALNLMLEKGGISSKFLLNEDCEITNKGILTEFYDEVKVSPLFVFKGVKNKRKIERKWAPSDLEKKIRNQYLHLSAKGGENLAKFWLSPDSARIGKDRLVNAPQPGNVRVIYENS